MPRKGPQTPNGAADIARRFGVTIKTLRLYESLGLIAPARTPTGWRQYDRADLERLHMVLAFRQLGLPLAEIVKLAKGRAPDVAATLELQARALKAQIAEAKGALALVEMAARSVAAGEAISLEDLAGLIRRSGDGRLAWTPELQALGERVFTDDHRRRMAKAAAEDDMDQRGRDWAEIYRDLAVLAATGRPDSPAAQALAERAIPLIHRQTGGDADTWDASRRFWDEGVRDPGVADQLPMTRAQWDFFSAAVALRLRARSKESS